MGTPLCPLCWQAVLPFSASRCDHENAPTFISTDRPQILGNTRLGPQLKHIWQCLCGAGRVWQDQRTNRVASNWDVFWNNKCYWQATRELSHCKGVWALGQVFWMWSTGGRMPKDKLHHPLVSEPSTAVPWALGQAQTSFVHTSDWSPGPCHGRSPRSVEWEKLIWERGSSWCLLGGDFKERLVSKRTFNNPLLQGESWLSPGLRVTLSLRGVLQDREIAISSEMKLQQGSCEVQAVPQPDAAQRLDTAQTICVSGARLLTQQWA